YDKRKRGGINEVKKILKQIESILLSETSYHADGKGLIIYSPGGIYEKDGVDKELINDEMLGFLGLGGDVISMAISSKELAVLAMNNGLTVQSRMVQGKLEYTIYGTKDQLRKVNVKMNSSARSKSIVKLFDSSKTNKYTKYGAAFMEEFPLLRGMTHSKTEMLKGFSASMKEPFTGGYKNLSGAGKLAKGLGTFGIAMTVTSNINSELADGFQGYTDVRKITVNSTVDVGVSGSLTAVLGQVGSSFGLPGAIGGLGVGLVLDTILSLNGTKDTWKNSINEKMQDLEDWFRVEAK
ncbi:T7SS effector LXG polymorphic toxin, partial [Listeria monocytogenes]